MGTITLDKVQTMRYGLICIPIVVYFCFVAISAAYVTDRYLFPIYAITLCMFLCIMYTVWRKLTSAKYAYITMCLVGAILIVNGFGNAQWNYLYQSSVNFLNEVHTYSDRNCISVYDASWKEKAAFGEIKNYKSVTFISQKQCDDILQYGDLFSDGFILNVIGGNDDEIISMIQDTYPYLNKSEKIGKYAYSTTYYISTGEKNRNVQIYNYDRSSVIGTDGFEIHGNVLLTQGEVSRLESHYISILNIFKKTLCAILC